MDGNVRRPPLRRLGAVQAWHGELRAGVGGQRADRSSTWRRSPLYYAACYETAALEAERQGLHSHAVECMRQAVAELKRATNEPKLAA